MEPRRKLSLWFCLWLLFNMIDPSECRHSRVCLWPQHKDTACPRHILKCEDEYRIRIKLARYMFINRTNYAKCSCGSEKCDSCPRLNQEKYPKESLKPCGNMNYQDLLSKCSYQGQCELPVPSQQNHTCRNSTPMLRASYSDIEYSCLEVNKVVDFCNGNNSGHLLSILYNSSSNEYNCRCRIKSLDTSGSNRTYFMRSMDIRNLISEGVGSFNLSFTSGIKTRIVVNGNVEHNSKLFEAPINQESVITLSISRNSKSPDRLWILVNGGTQVTCQSEVETTTPVGVIVGSAAGSVVVIAAIIVALIIFKKKRNLFGKLQEEQKIYDKPARNLVEDEPVYSVIEDTPKEANVQENRTGVTEEPAMSK